MVSNVPVLQVILLVILAVALTGFMLETLDALERAGKRREESERPR